MQYWAIHIFSLYTRTSVRVCSKQWTRRAKLSFCVGWDLRSERSWVHLAPLRTCRGCSGLPGLCCPSFLGLNSFLGGGTQEWPRRTQGRRAALVPKDLYAKREGKGGDCSFPRGGEGSHWPLRRENLDTVPPVGAGLPDQHQLLSKLG